MNDYGHNVRVIGKCSLCGGRVVLPITYMSTIPPKPRCESCGAVAAEPDLPVIPMKPIRPWKRNDPEVDRYRWREDNKRHWWGEPLPPRHEYEGKGPIDRYKWRSLFC